MSSGIEELQALAIHRLTERGFVSMKSKASSQALEIGLEDSGWQTVDHQVTAPEYPRT